MSPETAGQGPDRGRNRRLPPVPALVGGTALLLAVLLIAAGALALGGRGGRSGVLAGTPTATHTILLAPRPGSAVTVAPATGGAPAAPATTTTPGGTGGAPVGGGPALVVSGTNGTGVVLRHTPGGRQLGVYPEGTPLEQLGPDQQSGNLVWRHVRAPDGAEGWVAAQYTAPVEP